MQQHDWEHAYQYLRDAMMDFFSLKWEVPSPCLKFWGLRVPEDLPFTSYLDWTRCRQDKDRYGKIKEYHKDNLMS